MEFSVIIPARYKSTRLPGKMLLDIAGKPMVQHTYERAVESGAENVVIATDDNRIAEVAEGFGAKVVMTAETHASGTERLSEAVQALEYEDDDIVVCLQGDEPLIKSKIIRELAEGLAEHDNVKIASVCEPIHDVDELFDPHVVKVVLNRRHYAMYFSRAPIPWELKSFENKNDITLADHHYRHLGIYGYRVSFLEDYMGWVACPLEKLESLEQLRTLWHGGRVFMHVSDTKTPPGIDTEKDLDRVRKMF